MSTFETALQSHYVGEFITLIEIDLGLRKFYISNNQRTITVENKPYVYCPCEISHEASGLSAMTSATLKISNVNSQALDMYLTTGVNGFSGGVVTSIKTLTSELPPNPLNGIPSTNMYPVGKWKILQLLSLNRTEAVLSLGSELSLKTSVVPAIKMTRLNYGALV